MTYDPDIWQAQAGSSCHYPGQVRGLRLQVKGGGKKSRNYWDGKPWRKSRPELKTVNK